MCSIQWNADFQDLRQKSVLELRTQLADVLGCSLEEADKQVAAYQVAAGPLSVDSFARCIAAQTHA